MVLIRRKEGMPRSLIVQLDAQGALTAEGGV